LDNLFNKIRIQEIGFFFCMFLFFNFFLSMFVHGSYWWLQVITYLEEYNTSGRYWYKWYWFREINRFIHNQIHWQAR
jgi:hypothetical protein